MQLGSNISVSPRGAGDLISSEYGPPARGRGSVLAHPVTSTSSAAMSNEYLMTTPRWLRELRSVMVVRGASHVHEFRHAIPVAERRQRAAAARAASCEGNNPRHRPYAARALHV